MSRLEAPVRVCVRVRPLSEGEKRAGGRSAITVQNEDSLQTTLPVEGGRKVDAQKWRFDWIHKDTDEQEAVFKNSEIASLIDKAAEGYSSTVFAYGQTGSGKTHTMLGPPGELTGVIPKSAEYIFENLTDTCTLQASFLEIYNENIYDLLAPSSGTLPLRYTPASSSFFVENAIVVACDSEADLREVIAEGVSNRSTASHIINADSSRSHAILTIFFQNGRTLGKLNFVDLAGSERLKDSGSTGGALIESCHINKSLLALGQVITALSDGKNASYIPYRDSKLTKILMDSLGGACKTTMIACITQSSTCVDETVNTLKYAARTRCITTAPVVRTMTKTADAKDMKSRLEELRLENEALRSATTPEPPPARPGLPPGANHELICRLQVENERLRTENLRLKSLQYSGQNEALRSATTPEPPPARPGLPPGANHELICRLQVENERLRTENLRLKSLQYSGRNDSATQHNHGVLQFASKASKKNLVLQDFSEGSSVTPTERSSESPFPQHHDSIISELKGTLARVTLEADALSRGEGSCLNGIAAVVKENLRLVDTLARYDILKHAFPSSPVSPPRRSHDISQNAYTQSLEAQVRQLQAEIESLTIAPEPDMKQHILERRELRLQRETNAMLRLEIAKLNR
eukprot:TRINITY_DN16625_c0_g1_i3.p1 TRINITY_DN16625_c0_g1~~TRINITY_DN16625_c0_g1_i3.p1  ORF type:complete len:639 (+),score=95.63 TRINITY_DN16625_c0_g1_i3:61-1977(+)